MYINNSCKTCKVSGNYGKKLPDYFQETCFSPEAVLRIKEAQLEALRTGLDSRSTCNIPIPVSTLIIRDVHCAVRRVVIFFHGTVFKII